MKMQLANAFMITVRPTATRPERYEARLGDGCLLVSGSRQPFLSAARRLIGLSYDPTTVLVMRHAGSDTDCLTAQIGAAAKLSVREDRRGPRFVQWEPISRRVEALVSAKAKWAARAAPTTPTNPARDPAQKSLLYSRQIAPPPSASAAIASAGIIARL
jgi:hypothetical protein